MGEVFPQEPASFDGRVNAALAKLSPTERRVARFFLEQKELALLSSAAQIAARIGTSDATVVRTARSLGFDGLAALRETLLGEISRGQSPDARLQETLSAARTQAHTALDYVIAVHQRVTETLKEDDFRRRFQRAVDILANGARRHIFGIGPSGAIADYAAMQFNRIGFPSTSLAATGIALADRLMGLSHGDTLLVVAYAPIYREVVATIAHAESRQIPIVVVSDTLGDHLQGRAAEILSVPRGKADHLSMHAGTMVLIEAMIIGLAGREPHRALSHLQLLGELRGGIDKAWNQRHKAKRT